MPLLIPHSTLLSPHPQRAGLAGILRPHRPPKIDNPHLPRCAKRISDRLPTTASAWDLHALILTEIESIYREKNQTRVPSTMVARIRLTTITFSFPPVLASCSTYCLQ